MIRCDCEAAGCHYEADCSASAVNKVRSFGIVENLCESCTTFAEKHFPAVEFVAAIERNEKTNE